MSPTIVGRTDPIARLDTVSKSFGRLLAVDGVSLDVFGGEVHAVLGQNGAGKTTAMKVMAGLLSPDQGRVVIGGRARRLQNRADGAKAGIGFVQQHFSLIEELTCAENLLLGHPKARLSVDRRKAAQDLAESSAKFGLRVTPGARVSDLSMGERQRLEILIAVSWGAAVLILDEPTGTLGPAEFDSLASIIGILKKQGVAVVFISHKLPEVMAVADRVTVMRAGKVVWSSSATQLDPNDLALAMLGELPQAPVIERTHPGQVLMRLDQVSRPGGRGSHPLHNVTLAIRRSEVTGIAGVAGNGQRELAMVLLDAGKGADTSPRKPIRTAYIPEDRATDGLALEMSVSDNAIVRSFAEAPLSVRGWLRSTEVARMARRIIDMFSVSPPDPHRRARYLSGGNQQRLVLGRELIRKPDLVVAHNPTRGLDVYAAAGVRRHLLAARNEGAGVVVLSPDLDELMEVSDQIAVLYSGRLSTPLPVADVNTANLARLMGGVE